VDRKNRDIFEQLYLEQYGRAGFLLPIFLLLTTLFVEVMLAVLRWRNVITFPSDNSAAIGLAAMGGTYMFIVGDTVMSGRRRSLSIGDTYWYALRAVLAVPIGLAAHGLVSDGMSAFVAFGLGVLPVDALLRLIRHLTLAKLSDADAGSDQLVKLEGVTADLSTRFGAEGISSIEQLACMDPVLLAIRTGLPLKLIMKLTSRAVVRSHLGEIADSLVPTGLYEVRAINFLLCNLQAPESQAALADAVSRLHTTAAPASPTTDSLLFAFQRIVADPRSAFLV
jgi:hypothetical protein